ncbi:quinoprotein dehydrogenase-associated SoxYZ-like carrier [Poseidonocella sp. HB161398]|uniref:quinoprotein dehydrogenase-associated SoxYZ-like carrier n=1 Tax=Poseidonocella sp. HB161398 TaxID=2320855 RepID=UPI001109AE8A|nr:quinoprotein dehydrogenase-associated SoxYZ-like carrier [Poseidonocella sp. HB161398]
MRTAAALLLLGTAPALAGTWDDLAPMVFPGAELLAAGEAIAIEAPYRSPDDARARIGARIAPGPGAAVEEVTLILDENPMPVSAVFRLAAPAPGFVFEATMRINGPTAVHVVARLSDGRHLMAEGFVKTSGLGACSAPPGGDPEEALATLGQMELQLLPGLPGASPVMERLAKLAEAPGHLDLDIRHPSHSGMQMDQVSLLFIPMRYVETLEIAIDGAPYAEVTGSISLSENPHLGLTVPPGSHRAEVTMTDTDGTTATAATALPGY